MANRKASSFSVLPGYCLIKEYRRFTGHWSGETSKNLTLSGENKNQLENYISADERQEKKMKTKWILVLALVFLAALFLAACQVDDKGNRNMSPSSKVNEDEQGEDEDGGSKKPGTGENPTEPEEPTKPVKPTEPEPTEPKFPPLEPLSPEMESRIIEDYVEFFVRPKYDPLTHWYNFYGWYIYHYYGTYNDYIVVQIENDNLAHAGNCGYTTYKDTENPAYSNIVLGNDSWNPFLVWKEGEFIGLSIAYDLGYLCYDDIVHIAYECPWEWTNKEWWITNRWWINNRGNR